MQLHKSAPTRIRLNGKSLETEARTLADLVAGQGFGEAAVATAVNGDFVPRQARAATQLAEGDTVEIVAPRQGG
jgi:sulfur carrier protein